MAQLRNQILSSSLDSSNPDLLLALPPSCNGDYRHDHSPFHPSILRSTGSVKKFHPSQTEQRGNNRLCTLLSFRLVFLSVPLPVNIGSAYGTIRHHSGRPRSCFLILPYHGMGFVLPFSVFTQWFSLPPHRGDERGWFPACGALATIETNPNHWSDPSQALVGYH